MRCWPWSHDWEKWREKERGELLRRYDSETRLELPKPQRIGNYLMQERECRLCGKVELRRETALL